MILACYVQAVFAILLYISILVYLLAVFPFHCYKKSLLNQGSLNHLLFPISVAKGVSSHNYWMKRSIGAQSSDVSFYHQN